MTLWTIATVTIIAILASPMSFSCTIDFWNPTRDRASLTRLVREAVFVGDVEVEHVNRLPGDRQLFEIYYRVTHTITGSMENFVVKRWYATSWEEQARTSCFTSLPPKVGNQLRSIIVQEDAEDPGYHRLIHTSYVHDNDKEAYRGALIEAAGN